MKECEAHYSELKHSQAVLLLTCVCTTQGSPLPFILNLTVSHVDLHPHYIIRLGIYRQVGLESRAKWKFGETSSSLTLSLMLVSEKFSPLYFLDLHH